ncbi:MAG: YbaB/EbfC family nucleoid-associated protein [Gemmatimonadetes bacterium]|nr:YbaB/EbfC family nucleoid-associated protein [Gemmatimonadota bacterium]
MTDILKIMQQAQQMQSRIEEMQGVLQRTTVSGSAGGGMVTVEADGKGTVRKVKIDPSVVNPSDIEMLEDLVVVAIGEAQRKATELAQAEMQKVSVGMNLPFPMKLPF